MSEEQRARRTSILDQRISGRGRGVGERTPTYRGELLHYRKDFGTSMDDTAYKEAKAGQKKFKSDVAKARGKIGDAYSTASSEYATKQSEIDAYKSGIESQKFDYKEQSFPSYNEYIKQQMDSGAWTTLHVYDNGNLLAVHNLPKDAANNYVNQVKAAGANAWNDDGRLGVDVQGYGKELHHPIYAAEAEAEAQYNKQLEYAYKEQEAAREAAYQDWSTQKSAALLGADTASASLLSSYGDAQANIASQEKQLQMIIESNQQALNKIKNKYSKKLGNMKTTIAEMFAAKQEKQSGGE